MHSTEFPSAVASFRPRRTVGRDYCNPASKTALRVPAGTPKLRTFLVALVLAFLPAVTGIMFAPDAWYSGLVKAPWHPADWLFGPVWTILYLLSAIASWQVFNKAGTVESNDMGFYAWHLIFSGLWSALFFGLHSPRLALLDIILLTLALVGTIWQFRRRSAKAARLMIPSLLWVVFAASLNFYVVLAN